MGLFSKKPELLPGQTPCPHCGHALEWSVPNNQWFCRRCDIFVAPDAKRADDFSDFIAEVSDVMENKQKFYCQNCKGKLEWSEQHNRWFCPGCKVWL